VNFEKGGEMPYYEDFEVGQKTTSGGRTITDGMATALINIGGFTAPQFNDETVANQTPLGWRALPGRVTLALMGGLVEQMGILGTPGHGMLVGINNVRWTTPLRVGDSIRLEFEVTETRKTKNPRWGLVVNKETLKNQKGEVVCEADIVHLFEYRPT
jgi:acyl dehydratase